MTTTIESSSSAIRELVRESASRRAPVRVVGAGTWLDSGSPVDASESISTAALNGVLEYVPGDLTLTAGAGTPLRIIAETTGRENQWLALDPLGSDEGTIGATFATASFGPLATGFGTPRDLALGMEFVTGRGDLARAGGRVVKNVAGFDLTRLMTGAWGTLGIITEITVRLHARPERDVSIVLPLGRRRPSEVNRFLREWPFTPIACEVVNTPLASAIGAFSEAATLMRLAGNADSVAAQIESLSALGDFQELDSEAWTRLRRSSDEKWTFRLSRKRSEIDQVWSVAATIADAWPGALICASPSRGIVRCAVPPEPAGDQLAAHFASMPDIARTYECLPPVVWSRLPRHASNSLAQRIRATFDPQHLLNPGILDHAI